MVDFGSTIDVKSRLGKRQARKLLAKIVENGSANKTSFLKHAKKRMSERSLYINDIFNVLCTGSIYNNPEYENGYWRYRVETNKIVVIISFRSVNHIVIVTAWRK